MSQPRSILLVTHFSPPADLVAARRTHGMTLHLARRGHRVTVLTSMVSGSGPVAGAARVIRTRDLMLSPINWRRSNFEAIKGEGKGGSYSAEPSALVSMVVPDLEVIAWTPFALARAVALARRGEFDCVITSSPPTSVNFVGMALRRMGLPWVADFRDGWTFEGGRNIEYPYAWQRALDRALERASVRRADAVVAVTLPITDDFRSRLGADAVTITNGFDPLASVPEGVAAPVSADRFSFVYTGTISYGGSRPDDFLAAVRTLLAETPALAERIEVVFAGPATAEELAAIDAGDLQGVARHVGNLRRPEVLALQHAADCLVLFAPAARPSVATGKLYEYFAARKPILALRGGNVAARLIEAAGAGVVVDSPSDTDAIVRAMRELIDGRVSGPTPEAIEPYSYGHLAEQMEQQVELAIGRARG